MINARDPLTSPPMLQAPYPLVQYRECGVPFEERGTLNVETDVYIAIDHDTEHSVAPDVLWPGLRVVHAGNRTRTMSRRQNN